MRRNNELHGSGITPPAIKIPNWPVDIRAQSHDVPARWLDVRRRNDQHVHPRHLRTAINPIRLTDDFTWRYFHTTLLQCFRYR